MSLRLMSAIVTPNTSNKTDILKREQENSEKYIKQLLECVQKCQKRYGGKTELATEFDSCVASLCYTFELVFLHGLRTKPLTLPQQQQHTTTLKQVTEIVANSLSITNDNPSFWPFVEKHLTKHEQERYNVLKHIWTDTGRGRAWIRSALNERSLERYLLSIVNNIELLCIYYEDWALLRDQEKNNLLPTMAAGLISILFAVSIDKPELNSDIPRRPDSFKAKIEPVIEAPPPEIKEKKKRKIARQIISFDDDNTSITSIPSSNSSDNTSIKRQIEDKKVDHKMENAEIEEIVPETLTPIQYHASVGELTPISIETDVKLSDSPSEDDILEVPTDISAVLTAVETKNNELLQKKQKRIDDLVKENENLKEQLQKYVSAVKMLNNDDSELPNYQSEVKLYEKKLVQVAEMHAELMDFNVHLQKTVTQKDGQINRLKTELELLRGPMAIDDLSAPIEEGGCVNIWIPQAFLTGSGSNSHHVYQIFLHAGNDEWNIYRRYAEFYALHNDLKKLDPEVATFDFPPKKSIGNKDSALVEERRKRLQVYLRRIISHWPELSHCNSRYLLEQHLAFFKDQRDDLKNKKSLFSPRRSGTSGSHYTGL